MVSWDSKVHNSASSLFLWTIIRSGRLFGIRWSVGTSKSQRSLCISFSRTDAGVVHIPFVRRVNFKHLAKFPVDHLAHPVVFSLILFLCYSLRVFLTSISWWSFTGVWVTARLQDTSQYSNNAVIWMFSTYPLIYKYSSHFKKYVSSVPSAPFIIGTTVIFMFYWFFSFLTRF